MNGRKSILLVILAGIALLLVLSMLPRTFSQIGSLKEQVNEKLSSAPVVASIVAPKAQPKPQFDVASWYEVRKEQSETHGVLIESQDGNRLFASHNPDVTFNPASLIKLATSLVALRSLGPAYRFQTHVSIDGTIDKSGTLQGSMFVQGSDPTFGDAAAAVLGKALKERGIKRIAKSLSVSSQFCFNFSDKPEESGARLLKVLQLGNARVEVNDQAAGETLTALNSNPLNDILLYMNAHSSNFIAERVGALVGGPEGVQQFLVDHLGIPPDQVTIARTSGREHNRMTPRGLITVIRELVAETGKHGMQPSDIMPVATDDVGTLHRRLEGTGLEGAVVGKTGTLTQEVDGGMASLAGVAYTKDAGLIVFAILDQGNRIAEHRELEDQLLAEVIRVAGTPQAITSPSPRKLLSPANLNSVTE